MGPTLSLKRRLPRRYRPADDALEDVQRPAGSLKSKPDDGEDLLRFGDFLEHLAPIRTVRLPKERLQLTQLAPEHLKALRPAPAGALLLRPRPPDLGRPRPKIDHHMVRMRQRLGAGGPKAFRRSSSRS